MDEEHLKQRKKDRNSDDNKENIDINQTSQQNGAASMPMTSGTSIATTADTNPAMPKVTQSREEYFEALRQWLQQVQMQQTALAYFPYYLASSYQQMSNSGIGGIGQQYQSSASFYFPTQYNMFPQTLPINAAAAVTAASHQQQQNQQQQPQQPGAQQQAPVFLNNIFQQNRNNFIDNARRNTEGNMIDI